MILNVLLYIAVFLNCFVMGRIISTDCTNGDLVQICKFTLAALSLDTVILIGFTLAPFD